MFNKKLQDFCRFSGLTGVRTVSDELTESSYFDADSDQTLHSHESRKRHQLLRTNSEDGYVRLNSINQEDLKEELRRLRSSVNQFFDEKAGAQEKN